jgi:hypothetical protein
MLAHQPSPSGSVQNNGNEESSVGKNLQESLIKLQQITYERKGIGTGLRMSWLALSSMVNLREAGSFFLDGVSRVGGIYTKRAESLRDILILPLHLHP